MLQQYPQPHLQNEGGGLRFPIPRISLSFLQSPSVQRRHGQNREGEFWGGSPAPRATVANEKEGKMERRVRRTRSSPYLERWQCRERDQWRWRRMVAAALGAWEKQGRWGRSSASPCRVGRLAPGRAPAKRQIRPRRTAWPTAWRCTRRMTSSSAPLAHRRPTPSPWRDGASCRRSGIQSRRSWRRIQGRQR
jgi:hypothetical protein